jgi:serine/threonine-protein kinase RsbW
MNLRRLRSGVVGRLRGYPPREQMESAMLTHPNRAAPRTRREASNERCALRLTLPAKPESVGVVRQALGGVGSALDIDEERLASVRLAVTEACTNVVRHAYGDEPGPMEVRVRTDDGRLEVDVRDRGPGITPRPRDGSLGLGLPLIAALTERFLIARDRDGSTVLSMAFPR